MCSFTLFMQSSIDACLNFDEPTIEYISKHRCDAQGNVNYRRLAADMVIKTYIDFTGCIKLQWHIKQALDPNAQTSSKNWMIIPPDDAHSVVGVRDSMSVGARTEVSKATTTEVAEAFRKVTSKKSYKCDPATSLINLNQVSAMCPVLNLRKNRQHRIYLNANQMSMKSLHNKDRIRRYLRESQM